MLLWGKIVSSYHLSLSLGSEGPAEVSRVQPEEILFGEEGSGPLHGGLPGAFGLKAAVTEPHPALLCLSSVM